MLAPVFSLLQTSLVHLPGQHSTASITVAILSDFTKDRIHFRFVMFYQRFGDSPAPAPP